MPLELQIFIINNIYNTKINLYIVCKILFFAFKMITTRHFLGTSNEESFIDKYTYGPKYFSLYG